MKDRRELNSIKEDANGAKMKLISLLDRLSESGFDKDAAQLEKIIIRLEVWQNK